MAEYKKDKCKFLIAMGCLVERYRDELAKEIPEVDLWIKYSEYDSLWDKVKKMLENEDIEETDNPSNREFLNLMDRVLTTGDNFAYLKIADGCSNRCTYCAIPYIRGPQMSRKMEDIIEEAKKLAEEGYHEIILTAQDTTKYAVDLYGKPRLAELIDKPVILTGGLRELAQLEEISRSSKVNLFGFSRPLITDPGFISTLK